MKRRKLKPRQEGTRIPPETHKVTRADWGAHCTCGSIFDGAPQDFEKSYRDWASRHY